MRFWLGWFVVLNVLWLALISGFDVAETVLGVAASAIAATAATAVRHTRFVFFHPRPSWFLATWRLPWRTLIETVQVFGALWRRVVHGEPIRGRFRAEPFPPGRDEHRAPARRAVRTIAESVAPNTFVVGIDEDEHTVLVHELVPTATPPGRNPMR